MATKSTDPLVPDPQPEPQSEPQPEAEPQPSAETQPEAESETPAERGVDWHPLEDENRLQGETAEELVAKKSEDRERGDAYTDSFVLQTNKVSVDDLRADETLRGMAQQVINRALYKGLHAKAEPILEDVSVVHEGLNTQSVKFSWSVQVVPAVLDLDPSATVDKIQQDDTDKYADPVVSKDVGVPLDD